MSDLTDALERIVNWLDTNQWSRFPESKQSASFLKPGLSCPEIDSIIACSNLVLPPEVYELYQWRNGDMIDQWDYVGLFDIHHDFSGFSPWGFIPFQSGFAEYLKREYQYLPIESKLLSKLSTFPSFAYFHNPPGFEIFRCYESCRIGYVYQDDHYKFYPVVFRDFKGGSDYVLMIYASLTDMMLTIAESYETAYYIREEGELAGYLALDTTKSLEIWRKYNSEQLVEGILAKMKKIEPILPQLEGNLGYEFLKEIEDIFRFSHDERLIQPLVRVLTRPPTNSVYDENLDYLRGGSSSFLGSFGSKNTAIQLIPALQNEYWMIRYWVVIALGNLKNIQVIPHLNKLLEDDHELVRQAAQRSLEKITNSDLPTNS